MRKHLGKLGLEYFDYFLIVDLEATCCDDNTIKRHEMEIIEIGALIVSSITMEIEDEFQIFVKPKTNPTLTSFCTKLTSIRQEDVDQAPEFKEAMRRFNDWLKSYPNSVFFSWGDFDKHQLKRDCKIFDIPYALGNVHVNIKKLFSKTQELNRKYGMVKALEMAELTMEGTHHRGIDDARNMAQLLPYILGVKKLKRERIH